MRPSTRTIGAAAVVALLVTGATLVGPPDDVGEEHPEVLEPASDALLVCPYVGWAGGNVSQIGVLALDGIEGGKSNAEPEPIAVSPLTTWQPGDNENIEKNKPAFEVEERGKPTVEAIDPSGPVSFVVEASGPLAAGVAADTATNADDDEYYGYASTQCSAPAQEHWLVGGSGTEDIRGTLVLSNPTKLAAEVNVEIFTRDGQIESAATEGMTVPGNSQRVVLLEAAAAGVEEVAVHVAAQSGQVAAALESRETVDGDAQGLTYIPATQPGEHLVIPGIPADGKKTLELMAPGDIDAIVSLELMGESGSYQPTGESVVTVPAGRVMSVPLDNANEPVAVRLDGDQPIVGGVRVQQTGEDGARDVAYSAATPALTGPVASLSGEVDDEMTNSLMLSSTAESPSAVVVKQLGDGGAVQKELEVELAAGGTTVVDLEQVEHASRPLVVVEPAEPGTVFAARLVTAQTDSGSLVDIAPLRSVVAEIEVPRVVSELPEIPVPQS